MMKMVLLLTNKEDITVDFIVRELQQRNIAYYRLNTEEIPENVTVNFQINKNQYILYDKKKKLEISLEAVSSIYFRRPQISQLNHIDGLDMQERNYLRSEIQYLIEGIYKTLRNKFWLNNVYDIREAENKIFQLQLAQEVGFEIPNSLISNVESDATMFLNEQQSGCIIKPIKSGNMQDGQSPKVIYTSEIKSDELKEDVECFPAYIQENITKKYDIRCVVLGEKIYAAEIISQGQENSRIDWRRAEGILEHRVHILPEDIKKQCIDITKKFNLNYSAIDLVLDKSGRYYFLECNPNGQWAWLENRLGFDISKNIVDILAQGEIL